MPMAIGKIIGQGRTADIHEFDQDKIVKLFHEKTPEDWVDYEYKINLVANQFGCSVPKIHEKTLIDGRYGLVFDYIEGDLVTDLLKKPFQNPKHIAMHTASAHAKVNAVAFGSSGHPFDENSIVLSRQYDYFTKKIKASDALSPEEKDD
ncbi:phosphotransferase, partial [Aduncisulcus paluster]